MKTLSKTISLLRNDEQQVVANGYPDLRVNGVLGCSVECFYMQMLFDPLEEQLNLPTFTVQLRNGQRIFYREVVGQEVIGLASLKVFINNKPECVRILLGGAITGKAYGLVGKNAGVFVRRSGLNNFVGHVVLGSCDKVSALLVEVFVEFLKSYVTLVHQVKGASFDGDLAHNLGIVDLAGRKQNKSGNRASKVHERMHLESSLPVVELRPGTQLQAQLDGAAVERIYHLLKTNPQLLILVKRCGFLNQSHREVLIDTPILLLVGLRKRGFGHHLDAGSVEVSAEVKCSLNISQAGTVGELSEAHHHELVAAVEPDCVTVALVTVDTLLELVFIDERHNLRENCFSFVHGLRMASYRRPQSSEVLIEKFSKPRKLLKSNS